MPYIPHTDEDRRAMLETIGVGSIEDLFVEIPTELRISGLDVPSALGEYELYAHLKELSERNVDLSKTVCFLGAGIYDRFIPSSVGTVISRGEFLTAYTPYQPEASQGYLQTIYEFQTMVAELFDMGPRQCLDVRRRHRNGRGGDHGAQHQRKKRRLRLQCSTPTLQTDSRNVLLVARSHRPRDRCNKRRDERLLYRLR